MGTWIFKVPRKSWPGDYSSLTNNLVSKFILSSDQENDWHYAGYKNFQQYRVSLRFAKRLWVWHLFDFFWIVIKPINGGFHCGIPVYILPESWFKARIFSNDIVLNVLVIIYFHWKMNISLVHSASVFLRLGLNTNARTKDGYWIFVF